MQDLCRECGGVGCSKCNGTGWVGIRASPPQPLPKNLMKKCPSCDEKCDSDTCKACGYTSSIIKRKTKIKAVIDAIEEFERSVGASSDGMTLTDFEDAFDELTGTLQMKVVYKRRNEDDRLENLTE
ncbi:hypothetical protein KAU33_08920 [Candidatus Dependentiae bacterium]|nr:hypothetical protein [Candidatus Dependentiae bacterium]